MGEDEMTATSITMYDTHGAGFSHIPFLGSTTLTNVLYASPEPISALDWRGIITARLAELERLAPGWDSEGGLPVGRGHANRAIRFMVRLMGEGGVSIPDIVPLADGGVQLEWHAAHGRRVDFVSDEDSEPVVLIQDDDSLIERPARSVDFAQLRALLER